MYDFPCPIRAERREVAIGLTAPTGTFARTSGSMDMNTARLVPWGHANRGSCYVEGAYPGPYCWTCPLGSNVDGH